MQQYNLQGFVSFESTTQPGYYVRHQGYRLKIHIEDQDDLYKNDASFQILSDGPGNYDLKNNPL